MNAEVPIKVRRMLQPPKDELRRQLEVANATIALRDHEIARLNKRDRSAAGVVFAAGGFVGAVLTVIGGAL